MSNFLKQDEGIDIVAFPLSEATVSCQITMTFGEAVELCKLTQSGLPLNKDLQDWFLKRLRERLQICINQKQDKIDVASS